MQLARLTFATLAWLYLGLIAFQVFLAGAGVFGAASFELHMGVGYLAAFIGPVVLLVAATVARAGRLIGLALLVFVLGFVQMILPWLREDAPFIAALHPVNALVLAWLALTIATRATALVRARGNAPAEASGVSQVTQA